MGELGDTRASIDESVQQTLRDQARANELRLTYVRLVSAAFILLVDLWMHADPPSHVGTFSLANAAVAGSWIVFWVGLAIALHRGLYRRWMALVLPVLDGVAVYTIALVYWSSNLSVEFDYSGEVAVLLAASGGLRFRRDAIVVSTLSGLAAFAAIQIMIDREPMRIPFVCGMVLGAGVLGYWMNAIAHRSAASEVAKSMLARFLPSDVVESAHVDPGRLLGEPRELEATILVSDLRDFTGTTASMAPANALYFLNAVQGAFASAVWHCGGTVDKFMGDGMLAVFGAVDPPEGHASKALAAAAAMLDALDRLNAQYAERGAPAVAVGIGIHSGPVVAGCLGSGTHLEFTVIGDTVNTASRLEGLAKEYGVAVVASRTTVDLAAANGGVPAGLKLESRGDIQVRGRAEPVPVLAAHGAASSIT